MPLRPTPHQPQSTRTKRRRKSVASYPKKPRTTKRRGRHPDRELSAAFCRNVAEAGRYCDGNGLCDPWEPDGPVHRLGEPLGRHAGPPDVLRLEVDGRLDHAQRGRVGRRVRAADLRSRAARAGRRSRPAPPASQGRSISWYPKRSRESWASATGGREPSSTQTRAARSGRSDWSRSRSATGAESNAEPCWRCDDRRGNAARSRRPISRFRSSAARGARRWYGGSGLDSRRATPNGNRAAVRVVSLRVHHPTSAQRSTDCPDPN